MAKNKRQFKRAFAEAFKGSHIIESLHNYTVSDDLACSAKTVKKSNAFAFSNDKHFWTQVLADPNLYFGARISLEGAISSWVPRVPGLYWTKAGALLRKFIAGSVEGVGKGYVHLTPLGKTKLVMGGIGTLKFQPDSEGNRIFSVSSEHNGSMGIPLILPDPIWRKHEIEDGYSIEITNARWLPMKKEWEQKFPFIQGIPRACLYVDDESHIDVCRSWGDYVYHPFSIMEHTDGDAILYDYVFCIVYNFRGRWDNSRAIRFFEKYRRSKGREGTYLIAAEPFGNLFEARYSSPAELLQYDPSGKTLLDLTANRVRDSHFRGDLLDKIIKKIAKAYQEEVSVRRLGQYVGLSTGLLKQDRPAVMIGQLISWCLEHEKMEALIEQVAMENPELLNP